MKFKPSELTNLINASYQNEMLNIGKFKIDASISDSRVKTYTIDNSNDIVVTHRGSADTQDWVDNALYGGFNTLKLSRSYKLHLKKHKQAVKKYGSENIIVMGHSRGGLYAQQFYDDKRAKQLITYNKPVNTMDIAANLLKKKKNDENQTKIRTSNDAVSMGEALIKGEKTDVIIPSASYNPLKEHAPDRLNKIGDDKLIGTGIFKQKINFSKIKKEDLKQFVKNNKKKLNLDINITGLTKKDLVKIVEKVYT